MPLIRAGEIETHYQVLGEGSPTVVLIHGLLIGSLAEWYFTAGPVLAENHRVLMYDLRGHGKSERARDGYRLADLATDLHSLLGATATTAPLVLAGHSYGGLVALRYALDHPARVARLALIDTPLPPSSAALLADKSPEALERLYQALPGAHQSALQAQGRRARRMLASLRFLTMESTLLSDMNAEPDVVDDELTRLSMPVLALYGNASPCLPAGQRLARVLGSCNLHVLPGGHFLPIERAADVAGHLSRFAGG